MGSVPPLPPLGYEYGYKLMNNKIYIKTTVFDEVCNIFNSYYLVYLTVLEVLIIKETQFLRTLKTNIFWGRMPMENQPALGEEQRPT